MGSDIYTKLLLHCDGADGSTTFIDSATGKTVTAVGTAQLDTAQSVFGGASLLCDGNSDYLSIPDSDDWDFGAGNFTIDFRVRFNDFSTNQGFFSQWVDDNNCVFSYMHSNGNLQFYSISGGVYTSGYYFAMGPSTNTWYHLGIVRNGTNFYIFKDGVFQALTVGTAIGTNTLPNLAIALTVGYTRGAALTGYLNGWIDEFRVSKGIARWTANFTPPTKAYDMPSGGILAWFMNSCWAKHDKLWRNNKLYLPKDLGFSY